MIFFFIAMPVHLTDLTYISINACVCCRHELLDYLLRLEVSPVVDVFSSMLVGSCRQQALRRASGSGC